MTLTSTTANSKADLLAKEAAALRAGIASRGRATLIVPSHEQEEERKLWLAYECPAGVNVLTYDHWLAGLWDLEGDGRPLVDSAARHVLVRPLLEQTAGFAASSTYVDMATSFVENALTARRDVEGLSSFQQEMVNVLSGYEAALDRLGFADVALVEQGLAPCMAGETLVFEEPDLTQGRMRRMVQTLSQHAEVHVCHRSVPAQGCASASEELGKLASALFTGAAGLEPQGAFMPVEVYGCHAELHALKQIIAALRQRGAAYSDIALVLPNASDAYPRITQGLANAGIPFQCSFTTAFKETAFGDAFLSLQRIIGETDTYVDAVSFINSPYSGLSPEDASVFQMVWRGQAGSDHENRLKDLLSGLKGKGDSKLWASKLEPVKVLLQGTAEERARAMFANGRAAGLSEGRLADDAAAAETLIDFLELCAALQEAPSPRDVEDLSVGLARIAGDPDQGIFICTPATVPQRPYVIAGRLDQDSYPMALRPKPFDALLEKLGSPSQDNTAHTIRMKLLQCIDAADRGLVAYRICHDMDGAEKCQSALWDELMTAYRGPQDEGLPIHEVPAALKQAGLSAVHSEEKEFLQPGSLQGSYKSLRGALANEEALQVLLPDYPNYDETFSPTALEDYYRCPSRWLFNRRIGANSLDKEFDQIAIGNFVHAVLDRVYRVLPEQGIERVTQENLPEALQLASEAFDWQRQHEIERGRLNLVTAADHRTCESARQWVLDLVRRDADFLPGFRPAYLELRLEREDGSPLVYAGVPVRGKVDRIDVNDKGEAVVIDYKLSKLSSGYGLAKDAALPERIQTDIYATLVQRYFEERGEEIRVVGSVYRSYAANNLRGIYSNHVKWGAVEGVQPGRDALPAEGCPKEYDAYLADLESLMAERMERLKQGDVSVSPLSDRVCQYCLALPFCPKGVQ